MNDAGAVLPKVFARRHPKTGAPYVAITACAIVWALALNLSFAKLVMLDVLLTGPHLAGRGLDSRLP